jgi:streptogramin lyase
MLVGLGDAIAIATLLAGCSGVSTVSMISGSFGEYALPTSVSGFGGITSGPDNAVWFTEWGATSESHDGRIGRITLSGQISEFPLPTAVGMPESITIGPDNNLCGSRRRI